MKRRRVFLLSAWRKSRSAALLLFLCVLIFFGVAYLYRLPLEPFFYAAVLLFAVGSVAFAVLVCREYARERKRERMLLSPPTDLFLPSADTPAEEAYQQVILSLEREVVRLCNEYEEKRREDVDYYTVWVHQIKTPISVLRMRLSAEGVSPETEAEVFRIEQYVDMALQYIRIDSGVNDLVIKEYSLDELIRESVRKFAPSFVAKRLTLEYAGTDAVLVTDRKWFSCLLDQLLSNAVKYTPSGGVTVTVEEGLLSVRDTGIGIPPEDLHRIFEKGYTGENGRLDKKSSGLGLYLAGKAAELLALPLSVSSAVGAGTVFSIRLDKKR